MKRAAWIIFGGVVAILVSSYAVEERHSRKNAGPCGSGLSH